MQRLAALIDREPSMRDLTMLRKSLGLPKRTFQRYLQRLQADGAITARPWTKEFRAREQAVQEARFWSMVIKTEGCWIWIGCRNSLGYGSFWVNERMRMVAAYRVAWEWHNNAKIPHGLHLDHLCRNHMCVRPSHLEPVTPAENARRGSVSRAEEKRNRLGEVK